MLNLYSLGRRRERYIIIYVWKILEGHVPNLKINTIIASGNAETRRGRVCKIPKLKKTRGAISLLKEHSFATKGPKLFNVMPKELCNMREVPLANLKKRLDKWLWLVRDEPNIPGLVIRRAAELNSLLHQSGIIRGNGRATSPAGVGN